MRSLSSKESPLILAGALLLTSVVFAQAWVSDDCFITLRCAWNTVHGLGPVFNVGERVQVYTDPAWFLLLVAGSSVFSDPVLVAIGCGLLLTFLTAVAVGRILLPLGRSLTAGSCVLAVAGLVWSSSDPWVSFQTSGLENPLSNVLLVGIVFETWIHAARRPGRLMLLAGMLCLTRPDFAVCVAPLVALLLSRIRSAGGLARLALAATPVMAWLAFAWIYYHDVLPNSFYAKVGIFPSWEDAVRQGLAYARDWLHYDTLAAGSTAIFFAWTAWKTRSIERVAVLVGIALYVAWIVLVGGDFMRGRFFTPVCTVSILAGAITLLEQSRVPSRILRLEVVGIGCGLVILAGLRFSITEPAPDLTSLMIVNERKFYPGYSLRHYLKHGRVESPYLDLRLADALRAYAEACGPITVHSTTPGTLGYLAGPRVSIIDLMGITDPFVAKLPRTSFLSTHPRPGHLLKAVPTSYLVSRHDVALLPDWDERVFQADCSLVGRPGPFKQIGDGQRPVP